LHLLFYWSTTAQTTTANTTTVNVETNPVTRPTKDNPSSLGGLEERDGNNKNNAVIYSIFKQQERVKNN
jgi:hypothetical protein